MEPDEPPPEPIDDPVAPPADPLGGAWTPAPAMPGPRMGHAAVVFRLDLVVAGGIVGPGGHTASVTRLRPDAAEWEERRTQ